MAEYLSPAVYVEEIPSGIKPLEGVGTSTCAFIGHTEKGPIGKAEPLSNFSEYLEKFGGYYENAFLAFSVKSFFDEGGKNCYVIRTCHYNPPDSNSIRKPTAVSSSHTFNAVGAPNPTSLTVSGINQGKWGDDIAISVVQETTSDAFTLEVFYKGNSVEKHEDLFMDKSADTYVESLNETSKYIQVKDVIPSGSSLTFADRRPANTAIPESLTGGGDGLSGLAIYDFIGDELNKNALNALNNVDDVSIVCIPDAFDRDIHIQAMSYCSNRLDCFYIADSQMLPETPNDVIAFKNAQGDYAGGNAISSKYGALYTPWIYVFDPRTGGRTAIPPSGAVAGRYADIDGTRGVHKIAAGVSDGRFRSALGVTVDFSQVEQEKLNPKGIDVIRNFKGVGNVIWGARTVSNDAEWRYINVRRLFIYLRGSILNGTGWVVFEPNDRALWNSIVRNITSFLKREWMSGALVGATEDEAFYVKCDEETNPQESIDQGRVITEIGVAPSKPAEFVVFRISQYAGGAAGS